MFESGLECFHLKKPQWTKQATIQFLEAVPSRYLNRIVLHQHFELSVKYGLMGIHISRRNKYKNFLQRLYARYLKFRLPSLKISTTFRRLTRLKFFNDLYDYVFLGPVYDENSSQKGRIRFGREEVYHALLESQYRVFAFGGVAYNKIDTIVNCGFEGIAWSNFVWKSENPLKAFRSLKHREIPMKMVS